MRLFILPFTLSLMLFIFACENESRVSTIEIKEIEENNPEEASIRLAINNYFKGWITKDTSLIGSAMHPSCHLKVLRDGKFVAYDRATYLGFFKPGPARENSEGRIMSIDITGPIAAAKCELETPEKLYTDYFNMMKIGENWQITDKISTSIKK